MSGNPRKPSNASTKNATTKPSSWGARIYTLNTVDAANYGEVISTNPLQGASSTKSLTSSSSFLIQNITNLPSHEHAMALLRRIQSEFTIIAQKRGYVISSVTEMCCCADGLDHLPGTKKGRKTRSMPNNVLGYNLTQGASGGGGQRRRTVHRIHLRLRHPNRHTFYSYDDIAGVMCHELAHCEVGPHNAQFYKVMDEIMEQHAVYMVRGVVTDQSGFPINSPDAHVLGGGKGTSVTNDRNSREEIAQNRMRKQKILGLGGSFRLGGGFLPGKSAAASLAHLPPSEAAKIAAERRVEERRRNDSKYCLPCQEVIEILDASSDEEDSLEEKKYMEKIGKANDAENKLPNNRQAQRREIIILDDSDSCSSPQSTSKISAISVPRPKRKGGFTDSSQTHEACNRDNDVSEVECTRWTCAKCTFDNEPEHLACEVCGHEQNRKRHQKNGLKTLWETQIQELKVKEVEDSLREYGGFNIYGTTKKSSRTLDHIT